MRQGQPAGVTADSAETTNPPTLPEDQTAPVVPNERFVRAWFRLLRPRQWAKNALLLLTFAFTVNLADMLQVWSNDRFLSPVHRVTASADQTRQSAPFFLNPSYDTVCAPLDGLLARGEAARYRPVSWSQFRDQRSAGDYADYGHEIQIADFRLQPDDARR